MADKRLVYLASNNRHKQSELTAMLGDGWDVRLCRELQDGLDWIEDGETFRDNAMIKIREVRKLTDQCVLADDSGLIVDALGGDPGVHSSRYCGRDGDNAANNAKLLREIEDVPQDQRSARFVCYLIFVDEQGKVLEFEGVLNGRIIDEERGSNGFGYDPLFVADGYDRTNGELPPEEKNRMSHRYLALKALQDALG